jgi:dTDP-4-amino-4,6-dideoxy-D-galactose acyltransferase
VTKKPNELVNGAAMLDYHILDWDSDFFGFPVARVIPDRLDHDRLSDCVAQMKQNGVRLAYWASDPSDHASQVSAERHDGFLADRKVTYSAEASRILVGMPPSGELTPTVEEYHAHEVSPELERLALRAGVFSRYKVDAKVPAGKFEELYKIWIRSSVQREIAEMVYVIRHHGAIAGMVTVGEKNGRANIGLIAVADVMRGKGAGQALVCASRDWGLGRGFAFAQVVTQADNVSACRFYEKSGYHADKVEYIYHFWIKQ